MTMCNVYVGDLNEPPFRWEGGDWGNNAPKRLSPLFPPILGHYNERFHEWLELAGLYSKQTDYGCWVAEVTKAHIQEFIDYCYKDDERYTEPDELHETDRRVNKTGQLAKLEKFVESLNENKIYALVALED